MSTKPYQERRTQFLNRGGHFASFHDVLSGLLQSARALIVLVKEEHQRRNKANHITVHGPGTIVLTVSAFEAFLNESLRLCLTSCQDPAPFEKLIKDGDQLLAKFEHIPVLAGGRSVQTKIYEQVELVSHVRNELVHYYPRSVPGRAPKWLESLADQGLLYVSPVARDVPWEQKLTSFRLTEWCAEAIADAAQDFSAAISNDEADERKRSFVGRSTTLLARDFALLKA